MLRGKKLMTTLIIAGTLSFMYSYKSYGITTANRVQGINRYATAVEISKEGWEKSDYVVLTTGEDYPDALSAAPLAKKYNAPILLTEKNKLNMDTYTEMKRLRTKSVIIIGGIGSVSQEVEDSLTCNGIKVLRLSGENRYETSIKVAQAVGTEKGIMIVSGEDYSDALTLAPIAAKKSMPVVLVPEYYMTEELYNFINTSNIPKTYVLTEWGGISSNILNSFPNTEIIYAQDKYARNVKALQKFYYDIDFSNVFLVTAENYADALSASALAAKSSSPIIFADNSFYNSASNFLKGKNVLRLNAVGGNSAVSDYILNDVAYDINTSNDKQTSSNRNWILSIPNVRQTVYVGSSYELPKSVEAKMSDGTTRDINITWNKKTIGTSSVGKYTALGKVYGYDEDVELTVIVSGGASGRVVRNNKDFYEGIKFAVENKYYEARLTIYDYDSKNYNVDEVLEKIRREKPDLKFMYMDCSIKKYSNYAVLTLEFDY